MVDIASYSPKMQPYVKALLDAGYRIHPNWNVQQIKAVAQAMRPDTQANVRAGQATAWKRMRAGEGHLYLVALLDHHPIVKIGYGLDMEKRFATLRQELPYELKLIKHTPGSFYQERALHVRLWRYRWKGTYRREFYPADAVYSSGIDLPRGFMVGLNSILEGAHGP